jgi:hypothetical protein
MLDFNLDAEYITNIRPKCGSIIENNSSQESRVNVCVARSECFTEMEINDKNFEVDCTLKPDEVRVELNKIPSCLSD